MKPILELVDVSVSYDRVRALKNVTLSIQEGEIVALVGANGAGKSTTLRAISGLVRPQSGTIMLSGQSIDGLRADRIASRGISMVPEGRRIYPLMSVQDNLMMGAYLRTDAKEVRRDLERQLERFPRLKERWKQAAGTLSGGEQQMVAVSRALMAKPKLLLMDEPSLGLAPQVVRDIARTIVEINRDEGISILLVEQNSRMALKISSRAYALLTGEVVLEGASEGLLENPRLREIYLGS